MTKNPNEESSTESQLCACDPKIMDMLLGPCEFLGLGM